MGVTMLSAGFGLRLSVPWPEMLRVREMNWALSGTLCVPWPLKVIEELGEEDAFGAVAALALDR